MSRGAALYRAMLRCYPVSFREEYGEEMLLAFGEQLYEARQGGSAFQQAAVWLRAARDVFTVAPKEHWHVILQDVRYALRAMAASPGFSAVAILSLALGIGASTAIFSLWNGVLISSLPVRAPEQLVILSNPRAAGVAIGSATGERALLSYAEFEQLRDHAVVFDGVIASQSSLQRWPVRIGGGAWEEASGRLVSGGYFEVLGIPTALGRTFTSEADRGNAPYAVISHAYWQRRFGGSADALGKAFTVRRAALTVVGVTAPGFSGETGGQQPDFWIPLQTQPQVLPARDWLHDTGVDKVMWLHVFGRLRPGVSIEQAQVRANAIFKAGLESHYGSLLSAEARRQIVDQRLVVRAAAGGASNVTAQFADPLKVLLVAVSVLLLIACANIANLLLARGTARQREIVLRLSLGANRNRLIRQLLTESLVLASLGGAAGLAMAWFLHGALVRLMGDASETFRMNFHLEPLVLAFSFGVTVAAAVVFGLLPAWLATGADAGASLKGQGRTTTGSRGQLRWGRALVAVQLALSLPLLVGAGLLVQTLRNLELVDLGYKQEGLLVVRVDAQTAGYEEHRREPLYRDLLEQIRQTPGVRAASFSENGLFSGTDSGDEIEVEGYVRTGRNDEGARWDQVGPNYFSALGVPIILGREINEDDREGSPKVCVINEAFAKLFFAGRNPIGMHITTVYGDRRTTHQIVGVAKDMRTHSLRTPVVPRYFAPITQPLGEAAGVVFEIRTAAATGQVLQAVRQAIQRVDGTLPLLHAQPLKERLATRVAQDRIMARLTAVFGFVALALAAVGLYGVLSYGIVRRRSEIGIRMALGAEPRRVIAMILRETTGVLVAGLVVGAGLAVAASRLTRNQLYGLAPDDPLTMAAAGAILLLTALLAAYLPAQRAARLNPMTTLRQE